MSRAKFCVGEEVKVVFPSGDVIERDEILGVKYVVNEDCIGAHSGREYFYTGYNYKTSGCDLETEEHMLRKIPPNDRLSFEDMMGKIKEGEIA